MSKKARPAPVSAYARGFFTLLLLALVLGYLGRPPTEQLNTAQGPGSGTTEATEEGTTQQEATFVEGTEGTTASTSSGGKKTTSKGATSAAGLSCAPGKNGGKTDVGVSGTKIRLATTAVLDGPAASLLRDSPNGMKAVIDKVNASGGVCGRRLDLPKERVVNDAFRADLGHQYIRNFLAPEADIFALPVVPSAEGLSSAIQAKDIQRAGMPVVGSDGMRIEQYQDPYVWPVASATVSTMRIIAKYAYTVRQARTFAIIWDSKYKFGVEGADAFKSQVQALGGKIQADVPLDPDLSSYSSQIAEFNGPERCASGACDAVVMLLLPDTAKLWVEGQPVMGRLYSAGAQTLFIEKFAEDCVNALREKCHGFAVWTGYNPPIDRYASLPGVAQYVSDVTTVKPGIDVKNQFLEGAYFGMSMFVEALKKVGPFLTREELKKALDSMDYTTDLASDLKWRVGKHHANVRARSFSVVVSSGTFNNWRDEGTNWVLDPAFGG